MKLRAYTDTIALLNAVKKCRGGVFFKTGEGDILNLKSILSSYVFCTINADPGMIRAGWLEVDREEDRELLKAFLDA